MAMTATCRVSSFFVFCQFVFFLNCLRLGSGFSFIDSFKPEKIVIELNGTTNYSISCRTTDPNAITTLYRESKEIPIGGRVTLDKQVFTIHGISLSDHGAYKCKARDGSGTVREHTAVLIHEIVKEIKTCCPKMSPRKKVVIAGASLDFTCAVDMSQSLPKYLSFKWFKKVNGTYLDIPVEQTYRKSGGTSVLMIKNAQTTLPSGTLYKCQMDYRGKIRSNYSRLVVFSGFSKPSITQLGQSVVVDEPSKLKETCKASGFPVPKITWQQNGKQMPLCLKDKSNSCIGQNYQVMELSQDEHVFSQSTLIIVQTEYPRDQGNYTCLASNSEGSDKMTMVVSVHTLPTLDKVKSFWITNELSCQVTRSNPLPKISWQRQDDLLCLSHNPKCKPDSSSWQDISGSANIVIYPGVDVATTKSTLKIPKDALSAFFKCVATNVRGVDFHVMSFFSSGVARITIEVPSTGYDEDQTLNVKCFMVCKGIMLGWYKDGRPLPSASDPRVNITFAKESDRTSTDLVVERLLANDSGIYTCEAIDCITGQPVNTSEKITINRVFPPRILYFHNQTVYNQEAVDLLCNISAHPAPALQWYKGNSSLEGKIEELEKWVSCDRLVRAFYRAQSDVGKLRICKPQNALHTGYYTCIAANRRGESNATAFLNVLADPVIFSPNIDSRTQSVKLGQPWNITCQARGNPTPTVEWKRKDGNKSMTPIEHDGSTGVVLSIDSVNEDNLGIYFCVADNSINVAYAYVELVSDAADEPPPQGLKPEIIIAIGVVGGVLFIFIIVVVVCGVFFRLQRKQIKEYRSQFFPYIDKQLEIDPSRTLHEQCDNLAYNPDWEFPEERLILGEVLGSGAFGQVIKAEAVGITDFHPRDKSAEKVRRRSKILRRSSSSRMYQDSKGLSYTKTTVAVKTLKAGATIAEYKDLASELKILIHVGEHKNIVNLLGACTKGDRLLIIMEFAPHGNLSKFLRKKRDIYEPTWETTTNNPDVELTISNLVVYAYQIARGMEFLASKKCIHRDLATRNVLVGEEYVIKVADFGLARDVYKSDMYVKATNAGVLPVKWMALESLFDRVYTEKSDVWSFGVCLWEIFTLGGAPYPSLPTEQLLDFLSEGDRMEQPHNCPLDMYTIMRDCWEQDPDMRPTFAQLSERIGRILELHVSKQTSSAYITIPEESNSPKNNYYLDPVDSAGSALPLTGYAGINRQLSKDIANSPLPALPLDAKAEQDLEPDERQRMLEPTANGSLSGNESGIGLEEGYEDTPAVMERRPLRGVSRFAPSLTGKTKTTSKSKESVV